MSTAKQDRTRQYLRSWRSARRVLRGIAEDNAGSVADAPTSPQAPYTTVENLENSVEWENSFEGMEESMDEDPEEPLEDGLEESIDEDPEEPLEDGLEESIDEDPEEPLEDDLEQSTDEDPDDDDTSLSADLATWAGTFQVKHNAVDGLLKILRSHGHSHLPSCSRTLLKTPRVVKTIQKSGMEYVHFPLKQKLHDNLMRYPTEQVLDCIDVSFNIDGLPLFRSSGKTMWPILCAIHLKPVSVFPVTLTCGGSKPCDLHFLDDAIKDIHNVLSSGLQYRDRKVIVNILCIVCDAPAKAFVKNVKLCSGYYGCDRCMQRGEWHDKVTYQEIECATRTDESFRQQRQSEHHRGSTPFVNLPIDMIRSFPVDYMHQACLGVMKRLLVCWCRGQKGWRMSATQIDEVSRRLIALKHFIPSTFARKPRGLQELERWKATEFRQFMLYTGKIVLKGILKDDFYKHFMSFSVAMCILVSPRLVEQYSQYAADLMKFFVERGRELYEQQFLVYNTHSMLHLAEDAVSFHGLDKCSAFKFENYLQSVKRMVRSGRCPLSQVVRRLEEQKLQPLAEPMKRLASAFMLEHQECCDVIEDRDGSCLCRVFQRPEPHFLEPCNSALIEILTFKNTNTTLRCISNNRLFRSAIRIPTGEKTIFMAILHEI
ncbi:hypothetical protein N1851_031514 [Merluccius polli]|uniref:Transposase domain-containing protein n=1 Tax=Merluccius polli TaxID=89951 RepID=A0AA47M3R9_MERPO|nr:hypothetical protein N1851_031514 [Merluccius polli]